MERRVRGEGGGGRWGEESEVGGEGGRGEVERCFNCEIGTDGEESEGGGRWGEGGRGGGGRWRDLISASTVR